MKKLIVDRFWIEEEEINAEILELEDSTYAMRVDDVKEQVGEYVNFDEYAYYDTLEELLETIR